MTAPVEPHAPALHPTARRSDERFGMAHASELWATLDAPVTDGSRVSEYIWPTENPTADRRRVRTD